MLILQVIGGVHANDSLTLKC